MTGGARRDPSIAEDALSVVLGAELALALNFKRVSTRIYSEHQGHT
jgi:hypothetical protein